MPLASILFLALLLLSVASAQKLTAKGSPRKELLGVLAAAGCTNLIVANYIIDAVTYSIPFETVKARLAIIPNISAADISKVADPYMKALTTYYSNKKK